jgi:hypothetical protein|tara:strand:+ start:49237 stop:49857 length:621 start_codon:yes stop_codon:yes gene_type:complete
MNHDIFFIIITVSFLLIGILKAFYWNYGKLLVLGSLQYRYASQYLRLENALTQRVNGITFIIMIVNLSLLIVLQNDIYSVTDFLNVSFSVLIYFFLKYLLILFLGNIFLKKEIARLTIFFSYISDRSLSIVIFPFLVLAYFISFDINHHIIYLILFISALFLFFKIYSLFKIGTNSFGLFPLYIFLYLCILEIFPFVLVTKGFFYD